MTSKFNRRSFMRGLCGGGAVVVGIPTLDAFLNENGNAFADGAPMPVRLGTYFWGLGLTPGRWVPEKAGEGYELTPQLEPLGALRDKVSVFSDFVIDLDGKPNIQHWTGQAAIMTGVAASQGRSFNRGSFDVTAADALGVGTRFRSIEMTPFGKASLSYSTRTGSSFNTPETSPIALYTRIFGEGFQDPNSPNWSPDVGTMLRQSVLSSVAEQRAALLAEAGAADRAKLDQYFTSVRETEQALESQLQRPAPAEACVVPAAPEEASRSGQIDIVNRNSDLMASLTAMALACNQTKVFNVVHSSATSETYLPGSTNIYHAITHDEAIDVELGYQPLSDRLATQAFFGYSGFLHAMEAIPEGDGTLLDNAVVLGYSDTGNAKIHSVENIPMFIGGGAGGRHKKGQHIVGNRGPVSRVSLTVQQLAGLPVGEYGIGSMQTSSAITEIMA